MNGAVIVPLVSLVAFLFAWAATAEERRIQRPMKEHDRGIEALRRANERTLK